MSNFGDGGQNPPQLKTPVLENTTHPRTPPHFIELSKCPARVDTFHISTDSFEKQSPSWHNTWYAVGAQ